MTKYNYFVVPAKKRFGFITVAMVRPTEGDPDHHVVSFAFGSPRDLCRKVMGRKIAEGRLLTGKNVVNVRHNGSVYDVSLVALREAIKQGFAPSWAKRVEGL